MSVEEVRKNAWAAIDADHENMLQLWQEFVNVDCGTGNKAGVDSIGAKVEKILQGLGFKTRQVQFENAGNTLVGELGDMSKPFVIFTGHMDTVFKDGTAAERPFTIKDGKAYGPGCLDMKGGIVIFLSVLKALLAQGYNAHPIKVILAGDEETGHANSKGQAAEAIMAESKGAFAAFNFETGFEDGGLVVERKGVWQFTLEAYGRSAHVGNDPENGRSAIMEICHKAIDVNALTNWDTGCTFNVGIIEGGTVSNAVPAYAKIKCDMRYSDFKYVAEMKKKVQEIADKQYVPDTKTVFTSLTEFRNMQQVAGTQDLFELVRAAALEAGLPAPTPKAVGGGSDSAYTTAAGVPTICAMGVQGARNHTPEEYAVVDTLFSRAKLLIAVMTKI